MKTQELKDGQYVILVEQKVGWSTKLGTTVMVIDPGVNLSIFETKAGKKFCELNKSVHVIEDQQQAAQKWIFS